MNSNIAIEAAVVSDDVLVELSLDGDRDAFGQLVARYQSPICAMAFSACGNVERSEDVAQEVFVTAWRKLSALSDAAKFKSWLYGITRNLINNSFRQEMRNPTGEAEVLDAAQLADFDLPDEQAISKEEQAILWHVLSGLPQIYREPMVLFYRQNESVPAVADTLGISEESVRQRLSRGRVILADRVTRVVRSGLRRTGPGPLFAVAVIGGLPVLAAATTAKGTVMGIGVANSSSGNAGWLATLKAFGLFAGILAIPAAVGGLIGRLLGKDADGSPSQRAAVKRFWKALGWVMFALLFAPVLLCLFITGSLSHESRSAFLSVMERWLGFAYAGVVIAIVYWMWNRRPGRGMAVAEAVAERGPDWSSKRPWVVGLVTAGALGLLVFCLWDMNFKIQNLSVTEIEKIVQTNDAADLRTWVMQMHPHSLFKNAPRTGENFLWVEVHQNGKVTKYQSRADDAVVASIRAKGLECPTYAQGQDFEVLGTPGRMLPFVTAFVAGLGAVYLIKRRRGQIA